MSDDECPHKHLSPSPEVGKNGLLTGACDTVCRDCGATLFRDPRGSKGTRFYAMADAAGDLPPLVPNRFPRKSKRP